MTFPHDLRYKTTPMGYFLSVLGMVFIVEAIPYILFPRKLKIFAQFMSTVSEGAIQIVGILAACAGLIIIYLGRLLGGM